MEIFCNIIIIFIVNFDQFNAPLPNKSVQKWLMTSNFWTLVDRWLNDYLCFNC